VTQTELLLEIVSCPLLPCTTVMLPGQEEGYFYTSCPQGDIINNGLEAGGNIGQ
jgi:hypothetical protein